MITICVFLDAVGDIAAARRALADALGVPAHEPDNLDALHDRLGEIARPTTLIVRTGAPGGFLGAWLERLRGMLRSAEQDNACLSVVWA